MATRAEQRKRRHEVVELVRGLLRDHAVKPQQLVCLTPYKNRGSLSTTGRIEDYPLTSEAGEWRDGGRILVTTARSFKGLEAEVVVLFDVDDLAGRAFKHTDLYVACSRARGHLIVVAHGGEVADVVRDSIVGGVASRIG